MKPDLPERCLTCGGKTCLDDGEPKCLNCGGDPRVKRVLPKPGSRRTFSDTEDGVPRRPGHPRKER